MFIWIWLTCFNNGILMYNEKQNTIFPCPIECLGGTDNQYTVDLKIT